MADFTKQIVSKPFFELEIGGFEGIYGRDFTANERAELIKPLAEGGEDTPPEQAEGIMADLIRKGICDDQGNAFDNFSMRDIPERLAGNLMDVVLAEVYGLGKQEDTSTSSGET